MKSEKEFNFNKIDEEIFNKNLNDIYNEVPTFFDTESNIENLAYLNWRFEPSDKKENHFLNMAEGYFETAILLLKECVKNNYDKKADIWIFPILFNIVHGIEIYLKAFNSIYPVYKGLIIYGKNSIGKIEGKHNIKQLCETAIAKIQNGKDIDDVDNDLLRKLKFIYKFICLIYQKTDDMSFARYPLNKDKKQIQFYVSNTNITINLLNLYVWVVKLYYELSTIGDFLYYEVKDMEEFLEQERYYYESMGYYELLDLL